MKRVLLVCFLFGFFQLVLSVIVWGNIEYSIVTGDMVQNEGVSFAAFIFDSRLVPYATACIVNLILFFLFKLGFNSRINPGIRIALILAGATVFLTVPLSLNKSFKAPLPVVAIVAFIAIWTLYLMVSIVKQKRRG